MGENERLLRKAAVYLVIAVLSVRVVSVGWHMIDDLVVLAFGSVFLSFAIDPAVRWFERRGVRRGLGAITVLFGVVVSLGGLVAAAGAVIVSQAGELADAMPRLITTAVEQVNTTFGSAIDPARLLEPGGVADKAVSAAQRGATDIGVSLLQNLGKVLTILFLTFYFSADARRITDGVCSLVRPHRQREVRDLIDTMREKTGNYLASRAILAALSAAFHSVSFWLLGVPYSLPLGLWVGVVSQVIPVVGTYLAAALPVVVALGAPNGTRLTLFVLVAVTLYQQVENNVISPRVTRAKMRLHPIVGLMSVIVGSRVAGIAGALFAIPAAASLSSALGVYVKRHSLEGGSEGATAVEGGEDS